MMPDPDGLTLCRQIRELTDVPVIMITALHQLQNIVEGLEAGADDYVTKPFQREELLARARAVMRRAEQAAMLNRPAIYQDDYLTVDLDGHIVVVEGQSVHLTVKEYNLVSCLVQNAGRVQTYDQILRQVWGDGYDGSTEYIHVYISRIRKKLEPDPDNPIYLISEYGIGYRFDPAPVSHS
jgi:DNA-binding response OmpR family regulator